MGDEEAQDYQWKKNSLTGLLLLQCTLKHADEAYMILSVTL